MSEWRSMDDLLREDTEDSILELDKYRPRPALSTRRIRLSERGSSTVLSDRFLEGTGEKLSPADRRDYKSGKWLGGDATRPTD